MKFDRQIKCLLNARVKKVNNIKYWFCLRLPKYEITDKYSSVGMVPKESHKIPLQITKSANYFVHRSNKIEWRGEKNTHTRYIDNIPWFGLTSK